MMALSHETATAGAEQLLKSGHGRALGPQPTAMGRGQHILGLGEATNGHPSWVQGTYPLTCPIAEIA